MYRNVDIFVYFYFFIKCFICYLTNFMKISKKKDELKEIFSLLFFFSFNYDKLTHNEM